MSDILSKEEMEVLLKGGAEKNLDLKGKIVRPYDFHSPERLSKEHLRVFQMLMEDFCHRLRKRLSQHLRLDIEVNINSIRQTNFKEFLSIPYPSYIGIFTMKPLDGTSAIVIETGFLVYLMEQLLGAENAEKPENRELTQIETETATVFASRILGALKESFEKTIKFETQIESTDSNPQFVVLASPNEAALFINLDIKINNVTGTATICLPYLTLEALTEHLDIKKWFMYAQKKAEAELGGFIKTHLSSTKLTVVCKLGDCEVTLKDLMKLQAGDFIRLDKAKEGLLEIQIGGLTKFYAKAGLSGKRVAAKIESLYEEN